MYHDKNIASSYFRFQGNTPSITCTWKEEVIQTKIPQRRSLLLAKSSLAMFMAADRSSFLSIESSKNTIMLSSFETIL